jgi:two-component system LytT family response regulator
MFNVLILEDEHYTLRYLHAIISEHSLVRSVSAASTGRDAVQLAQKQQPNVAFLDIELSPQDSYTGLEVAKHIASISPATRFVFITGYSKYALESFVVHPFDYVLKPVKKDRVFDVLNELAKEPELQNRNRPKRIVVQSKQEMIFLIPSEIFFFEKQDKKTLVHTRNGVYELARNLNAFSDFLPKEFVRTHKSFIVNINRIRKVKDLGNRSWEIIFQGYDKPALLSRNKYQEHKELFSMTI